MPAVAADDVTVTASGIDFDPSDVTIAVGDTVRFANSSGTHNFAFADEMSYPATPADPADPVWNNLARTFTTAGEYRFVCEVHEANGMTGVINVRAATPTPTPTPTPPPSPSPTQEPLEVRTLRVTAPTFCTKRTRKCRKPGVRVRIDLSQPAKVTGALSRGTAKARSFGRVRFGTVAAGVRTLNFRRNAAGKRLTAGRYRLKLTIAALPARTLKFKVR